MLPYIVLIVLPAIIWIFNNKLRVNVGDFTLHKTESLSLDVFMIIFLFMLAFRGLYCGIDTVQYLRLFNKYTTTSIGFLFEDNSHEFGYKILNKFTGILGGDFQSLIIITSLICVIPIWYFYKKESENFLLTIVLFMSVSPFVMFFSGIRQAMAMAIGVFSWYAAKHKKLIWFIAVVLLAIQFHTSAFVLFVIYPLYHAKITKKWLWFVIPCMLVVYYFRDAIFGVLMTFLWKEYNFTSETGAYMVLLLLIMFAVYSYVMVREDSLDQDTVALRNLLLLSVVLQIFAMLHPLSMRINYYFLIFVPVLIPKIVKNCKKEFETIAKISVAVMILYFSYYFIDNMVTDNDPLNVFPYIPFWENNYIS